MTTLSFRRAVPQDADAIVSILRSGFSPEELDVTILACAGVSCYVERQIRAGELGDDCTFWLATDECHRPVACVQLRTFEDELFLNYISVTSDNRATGLGSRLLKFALEMARDGQSALSLDVREDNDLARGWYERMGFAPVATSAYWDVAPSPVSSDKPGLISGYPQAMASHDAYGFSQLVVTTHRKSYSVGLLGDGWFRIADSDALQDPQAITALRRLSSSRRILALLPGSEPPCHSGEPPRLIQKTVRMSADIDTLMDYLQRRNRQG
jgi:GNAT superfamily N-acetyltransferase